MYGWHWMWLFRLLQALQRLHLEVLAKSIKALEWQLFVLDCNDRNDSRRHGKQQKLTSTKATYEKSKKVLLGECRKGRTLIGVVAHGWSTSVRQGADNPHSLSARPVWMW